MSLYFKIGRYCFNQIEPKIRTTFDFVTWPPHSHTLEKSSQKSTLKEGRKGMYAYRLSLKKDVIRYKSEASQRSVKRRRIEYLIFLRLKLDLFGFFSTTTSI